MRAHVWSEGSFVLLLHGAAILSTIYDKRSIFSVKQLSVKSANYSKFGIILKVNNEVVAKTWMRKDVLLITYTNAFYMVSHILYSILLLKDPSS